MALTDDPPPNVLPNVALELKTGQLYPSPSFQGIVTHKSGTSTRVIGS